MNWNRACFYLSRYWTANINLSIFIVFFLLFNSILDINTSRKSLFIVIAHLFVHNFGSIRIRIYKKK